MALATDDTATFAGFGSLPLRPDLLDAVAELGYDEPTPIQRAAIPPLVEGRDVLGQAATGTGKTAAFALPVLERLEPGRRSKDPGALAVRASPPVDAYGRAMGVRVLPVYGGAPIVRQLRSLERGVDVVVGPPGRVLDHLGRSSLEPSGLEMVVLDEADEMLDMGF